MNTQIIRFRLDRLSPNRLLLIFLIWFVFPFVVLGKYSYIYTGDNFEFLISQLVSLGNNGFNSSLWNPLSSSGTDIAAMGFTGPINRAVFTIFPGWLAYQILIVAQTVAAILGSYYLCRRIFKLTTIASLLPSIIFGVMLPGQLIYSVPSYIPALILSLSYLLDKPKSLWAWLFATTTILWLSGTVYISWLAPFPSALLIGWFLFVEKRRKSLEWIIVFGAAIALPALRYPDFQALTQITPLAHITLSRSLPTITDIFAWPSLLGSYINILCAGLFVYSWVVTKPRSSLMRGVALFLIFSIFASPLASLIQIGVANFIPFIQGFDVSKISKMVEVVLWLSSAFAVGPILENLGRSKFRHAVAWVLLVNILAGLFYHGATQKYFQLYDWLTNGNYVQNLESPVIRQFAGIDKSSIVPARSEFFQGYSIYLQPYGIETAGGYEPLYMRRYYEFWSTILEPWGQSEPDPSLIRIYNEWPYFRTIRLYLTTYTHQPERRLGDLYRLNLLSMANVARIFSRDKLTDLNLELVHGDFKPWSSLTKAEKIITNLKANFFGRDLLFVYNNPQALPRFISPSRVKVFENGRAVLGAMANSTVSDLSNILFISRNDVPEDLNPTAIYSKITVKPISYENDIIELEVGANSDGLLVGFNAWSPFW